MISVSKEVSGKEIVIEDFFGKTNFGFVTKLVEIIGEDGKNDPRDQEKTKEESKIHQYRGMLTGDEVQSIEKAVFILLRKAQRE